MKKFVKHEGLEHEKVEICGLRDWVSLFYTNKQDRGYSDPSTVQALSSQLLKYLKYTQKQKNVQKCVLCRNF